MDTIIGHIFPAPAARIAAEIIVEILKQRIPLATMLAQEK